MPLGFAAILAGSACCAPRYKLCCAPISLLGCLQDWSWRLTLFFWAFFWSLLGLGSSLNGGSYAPNCYCYHWAAVNAQQWQRWRGLNWSPPVGCTALIFVGFMRWRTLLSSLYSIILSFALFSIGSSSLWSKKEKKKRHTCSHNVPLRTLAIKFQEPNGKSSAPEQLSKHSGLSTKQGGNS